MGKALGSDALSDCPRGQPGRGAVSGHVGHGQPKEYLLSGSHAHSDDAQTGRPKLRWKALWHRHMEYTLPSQSLHRRRAEATRPLQEESRSRWNSQFGEILRHVRTLGFVSEGPFPVGPL